MQLQPTPGVAVPDGDGQDPAHNLHKTPDMDPDVGKKL